MNNVPDFLFELDEELSEGNLVALRVTLPSRHVLQIWSELSLQARTAILRQFAIYGVDVGSRELGASMLRQLAQAAMEEFDVDIIRIEEARRTSGANPNRTVAAIEFRRR